MVIVVTVVVTVIVMVSKELKEANCTMEGEDPW